MELKVHVPPSLHPTPLYAISPSRSEGERLSSHLGGCEQSPSSIHQCQEGMEPSRLTLGPSLGQTGGPGRQAAENRPWECLSVTDSARTGGRAGRAGP